MKSPYREKILQLLQRNNYTAAEMAEAIGKEREPTYTILTKMHRASMISMEKRGTATVWTKHQKPEANPQKPDRVHNGTIKEPLTDLGFTYPMRSGAMDAYRLPSRGIGGNQ